MNDLIILGTDTDAGKTTFALLWLHAFGERYEYCKPVETGPSDSELVAALCPAMVVHPPVQRFRAPVAPLLAARLEGLGVQSAREIAAAVPRPADANTSLLIETFGGPFSPLTDDELQIALIRELRRPCVLVSSSKLGAIGRTVQCLAALQTEGVLPFAVVLLGEHDPFAEEQIRRRSEALVVSLQPPEHWIAAAVQACAEEQRAVLGRLFQSLKRERRQTESSLALQALKADDRRCVWHPYTPLIGVEDPLQVVGAHDEFLELADGRTLIDGISSWWTILHGHRHPPLMRALAEAARRIDHVHFAGVTHPDAARLADLLLGTMPWVAGRVFYSDNGSTAVEVALKMAYQYWCHQGEPERTSFVGFEHGYHGDTFGAMAVGRDPLFFGRFEPLMFHADILPLDPARLDAHLDQHARRIAAVIVEPLIQGAGGMHMHTPDTLQSLADVARFHGVLFIADEVMTGGGRTGTLWAHQAAGVVPDLLCAAKTLTGGVLPLAATLASPKIVAAFETANRTRTFFHGHSFTANPLACAVAAANLRSLVGQPLAEPKRIERFWREALMPLHGAKCVKEVRIRGCIAAVELDVPGGYLAEVGAAMRQVALEHGVLLRPLGNVLYALPPYCISEASLHRVADAMIAAVKEPRTK